MFAVPLPFVVSLLLLILTFFLWFQPERNTKTTSLFVLICALATAIVGLRWTVDWQVLKLLQPVVASWVPVGAWYCFQHAREKKKRLCHLIGPSVILMGSLTYPLFHISVDYLLVALYLVYGVSLLSSAPKLAAGIPFDYVQNYANAEKIAGYLLIFSAAIDLMIAISFGFFEGRLVTLILTLSYALLLPLLVVIVVWVGLYTQTVDPQDDDVYLPNDLAKTPQLTQEKADEIVFKFDQLMKEQEVFKDPDLTLNRLSRKLLIPQKQLSTAINRIYQRNISQVINQYRIEFAKARLVHTDESITQIYMSAGFHSKSNFNREFSRMTGVTPSEFRRKGT